MKTTKQQQQIDPKLHIFCHSFFPRLAMEAYSTRGIHKLSCAFSIFPCYRLCCCFLMFYCLHISNLLPAEFFFSLLLVSMEKCSFGSLSSNPNCWTFCLFLWISFYCHLGCSNLYTYLKPRLPTLIQWIRTGQNWKENFTGD